MRLMRWGAPGAELPGVVLANGALLDVSASGVLAPFDNDYGEKFFAAGKRGFDVIRDWIDSYAGTMTPLPKDTPLGPPTRRPGMFWAVGINDPEHAKETNSTVVSGIPVMFPKSPWSHCGFNQKLLIPQDGGGFRFKIDWEIECGFVILGAPRNLPSVEAAANHIGGLFNVFDGSDRVGQLEDSGCIPADAVANGKQWGMGKGYPTAGACGPFLLTPDEVGGDLSALDVDYHLALNGDVKQQGSMAGLTNNLLTILHYLSWRIALGPGDIVTTGTPKGVGMAEGRFLQVDDTVVCGMRNKHQGADFGSVTIKFEAEQMSA